MIGTKLAHYEITSHLGTGGMGEVYQATDSKLGRSVAIKLLPEAFTHDPDRAARFEREARVLASLNHPNIAGIYGIEESGGRKFLVMELVSGETLAERIKRGAIPVDEALGIAKEIAEGLEAAHEKGIIHRDLKPANVKITPEGKVKVLDFGLAKAFEGNPANTSLSNSPTLSIAATNAGLILGTAAYMSPEQARGQTVDKRTDIFALGCVLYEMLTGTHAFHGGTVGDILAAVIRAEPDWTKLPGDVSPSVRKLLRSCLEKDVRKRRADAADVRLDIDDSFAGRDAVASFPPQTRTTRILPIALGLAAGLTIASIFWWLHVRSSDRGREPLHLSVSLPNGAVSGTQSAGLFAISPDGRWIVLSVARGGKRQLFLRSIQEFEGKPINGTEGALKPFFSPDSQWIAFGSGKELKKVPVSGGSPVAICSCVSALVAGAWGSDNKIVFIPDWNLGLWSVSADGGMPQLLLKTDEAKDRIAYDYPTLLPDGKGILFDIVSGQTMSADEEKIAILEPGAAEPRILIQGGSNPTYLPTGHLLYGRAGALLSVAFDLSRLAVTGTPAPLMEGIEKGFNSFTGYAVSQDGTLVYEPGSGFDFGRRFAMVDRKGNVQPITARHGILSNFALSPDARHIAARVVAINDDIWTYDVATGAPLRLTSEPLDELFPQWSADGIHVAFSTRTGKIFWKLADGSGQREELSHGENPRQTGSFSPDGKTLAFMEIHPSRQGDIWLLPLDGDRKAQPLVATDANETSPRFSPNGQWLAYVSNETGRDEVYVRPLGSAGGRKQVSTEGGTRPAWARNGRELFFVKGDKLLSVMMDAQANPVGRDHIILDAPKLDDLAFQEENSFYDVMPDGEHFVMVMSPRFPSATHYNVIVNWFEELRRKASNP